MDNEGNMTNEPNDSIFKHFSGLKYEESFNKKEIKIITTTKMIDI